MVRRGTPSTRRIPANACAAERYVMPMKTHFTPGSFDANSRAVTFTSSAKRRPTSPQRIKEPIMFARLTRFIAHPFADKGDHAHDAFLSASPDIADLERRMRQIDEDDHAYGMHFCGEIPRARAMSASNF
jgi:hypothetical protein